MKKRTINRRVGGNVRVLPLVIVLLLLLPAVTVAQERDAERIGVLRLGEPAEDRSERLVIETVREELSVGLARLDGYDVVDVDSTAGAPDGVDYAVSVDSLGEPEEQPQIVITIRNTRTGDVILTITEPLPTLFASFERAEAVAQRVVDTFRQIDSAGVDVATGAEPERDAAASTPWQQDRITLDQEYRAVLEYRYYRDGRPQFTREGLLGLIPRSREILDGGGTAAYTPEEYRALQTRARRTVDTLVGVMLLASDYQVVIGRTGEYRLPYDVIAGVQKHGYSVDETTATALVDTYQRSVERQRPLWQVGLMTVGALGIGTAGVIFGTGMPMDRVSEGEELYDDYQAATDPDEAARLREATEAAYGEANTLFLSGAVAGAVGISALTAGILTRVRSVQAPERVAAEFLAEAGDDRVAAAISFFEDGDRDRLVVLRDTPPDSPPAPMAVRLGDETYEQVTDRVVYFDVKPGALVTVHSGAGSGNASGGATTLERELRPGRNIIYIPQQ